MSSLRLVQFDTPHEFLQAVEDHDDAFLNFPIGALLDSMNEVHIRARDLKGSARTLLAVYDGISLVMIMVKVAEDFAWILAHPRDTKVELGISEMTSATGLLVSHLSTAINPKAFDEIIGPEELVDLFIRQWVMVVAAKGLGVEVLPDKFRSKVSYATLATIPPPPSTLSKYSLEQPTSADVDVISHFFVDFTTHSPRPMTLEAARTKMLMHIGLGEVWICRVDGEIAGFCATGRVTPKTIAIRNVYVSPQYRRKGIADAMTRMLTRYLLGAEPLGFGGGLAAAGPPPSIKREVALNVALDYVEKIYKGCGFLLGEDDRDPQSGKKGWFTSVFRGVRLLNSDMTN